MQGNSGPTCLDSGRNGERKERKGRDGGGGEGRGVGRRGERGRKREGDRKRRGERREEILSIKYKYILCNYTSSFMTSATTFVSFCQYQIPVSTGQIIREGNIFYVPHMEE